MTGSDGWMVAKIPKCEKFNTLFFLTLHENNFQEMINSSFISSIYHVGLLRVLPTETP